ncbi:Calcium-dependent secretion activator 2 [Chelonia mydas]|uniref:Calcium-dependent secretion activator 2 n=1 Tax=Chelonia mydas TaxID=8469 RepID=M7AWN4_CHEMY|nr:Calcium-dependent secretion activator 2 [Chelonia mydas]
MVQAPAEKPLGPQVAGIRPHGQATAGASTAEDSNDEPQPREEDPPDRNQRGLPGELRSKPVAPAEELKLGNGSATSEDLFWKLDALQMFVFDLHWPEPEFAHHLEQRLKLMASDMIEACVKRTRIAFELKLQKTNKSMDLRIPASVCTMFNVLVDAKKQTAKLCILDGKEHLKRASCIASQILSKPSELQSLPKGSSEIFLCRSHVALQSLELQSPFIIPSQQQHRELSQVLTLKA